MKHILFTIFILLIISIPTISMLSCNKQQSNNNQKRTTNNYEPNQKFEIDNIEITTILKEKDTPTGISIITLADGKKFMYCEVGGEIDICQIFDVNNIDSLYRTNTINSVN